jgi:hypothetical protein
MARVTCRCGEKISVRADSPDRIDCPKCGARIRLRRSATQPPEAGPAGDGYLRFYCPCGRRLKVPAQGGMGAGKCPDCGRVVPVPASAFPARGSQPGGSLGRPDPDARTEDMDAEDLARLERWAARHLSRSIQREESNPAVPADPNDQAVTNDYLGRAGSDFPSVVKFEAGLRICPRCRRPVHLGASTCRECGSPVPRS